MPEQVLHAERRGTGKGHARKLRRAGTVKGPRPGARASIGSMAGKNGLISEPMTRSATPRTANG